LYGDVHLDGRQLIVKYHDEHSYIIQARMLAEGKLWMPRHEAADSFQSFHILTEPVYASIYFPGTALINVPMVWLNLPPWLIPLILSGFAAALLYWIVTELVDGVAGLACVILLLGSPIYRGQCVMVLSQPMMLFLGLAVVACWLMWRRHMSLAWTIAIGGVGGLAAITRPVEALAYCIPIGISMLWRMRAMTWRRAVLTLVVLVVPALPFLALQAIHNKGTTGHFTRFASDVFAERFYPAPMVGFHDIDPKFVSDSVVPAIRTGVQSWVNMQYFLHRWEHAGQALVYDRLPTFCYGAMPNPLLFVCFTIGWIGLFRNERWVLGLCVPLALSFYFFYAFYLIHYPLPIQPGVLICIALAGPVIGAAWPKLRARAEAILMCAFITSAVVSMPQIGGHGDDAVFADLGLAQKAVAEIEHKPAIVLFHFVEGISTHQEPVYNIDVVWPDDAPVVRAHDLGPALNQKLLDYYARVQPNRHVYYYDRGTATMYELGNVVEVAKRGASWLTPKQSGVYSP
jgi:hypothetical protein